MKRVGKTIALLLALVILAGTVSFVSFAQKDSDDVYYPDDYPWLTLGEVSKTATDVIRLRVGETCEIAIMNLESGIMDFGGTTLAQYWLGEKTDENRINMFTLWRVKDSSIVDFTEEYKSAHPSEYETLPMLEQDARYLERYDMCAGFIPYLKYNFTESDIDESGYEYGDIENGNWGQRRAVIVGKKAGTTTIEVAKGGWGITCPARGTLTVICYDETVGDVDGDGEVTVADALSVLRVAAKLAPQTISTGASYDFNSDGEVTVADALAILRIAARLA